METPETLPLEVEEKIDWLPKRTAWGTLHRLTRDGREVGHIQAFTGSLYKVYRERAHRPAPELISVVKTNLDDARIILEDATWDGPADETTPPQHFCAPLLEGSRAHNTLFSYAYAEPLAITRTTQRWELTSGPHRLLIDLHYCPFCGTSLN